MQVISLLSVLNLYWLLLIFPTFSPLYIQISDLKCFCNNFKSKTFKNRKQICTLKRRHVTYTVSNQLDISYILSLNIFMFLVPYYFLYLLTLLFISLIWEWQNSMFDLICQSVKRFIRCLITKCYNH